MPKPVPADSELQPDPTVDATHAGLLCMGSHAGGADAIPAAAPATPVAVLVTTAPVAAPAAAPTFSRLLALAGG